MNCDGSGKLPCTCGAAEYTAARGYFRAPPPCTCGSLECPGCERCRPTDDAERERQRKAAETSTWYHAKIGTAPPRAKAAKAKDQRADRVARDGQGRLF